MEKYNGNEDSAFFDYAIVGAGASGLWLATEMERQGLLKNARLFLIDENLQKGNDRTWCFWRATPAQGILRTSISHSWEKLRFKSELGGNAHQVAPMAPYHYHHIRSADFYGASFQKLCDHPNVQVSQGKVRAVAKVKGGVSLHTSTGVVNAQLVFTSVPLGGLTLPKVTVWQSFVGWRIRWKANVLQPDHLRLMDFDIPQNGHTQFMYLLPFGEREALVECTRFGKAVLTDAEAAPLLQQYVRKIGDGFEILETETGKLPMTMQLNQQSRYHQKGEPIVEIGTIGGALKPTTGYGFLQMRQHAREVAKALKLGRAIPKIHRKRRFKLYDHLLLRILSEEPQRGKEVFERLFARQPANRILKFLDEQTSILEELRIFSVLPIPLFVKTLMAYIFRRWSI